MKKLIVALLAFPSITHAGNTTTDNSKTAVITCGAGGVCDQVINAIGDPITIDLPENSIIHLGTMNEEKTVRVTLPKEFGTRLAYSFVPTSGEVKGQTVAVVFDNIKQRAGTRLTGKSVIKVYRRFTSDPESTWYELGKMEYAGSLADDMADRPLTADITIKTDGTAVWVNPITQKPSVFLAGTKDLQAATRASS